jgi:type VI secretion system protein ImpL
VTGFLQTISQAFSGGAVSHVTMIVGGIIAAVLAGFAWFWSKHPVRWILVLLTLGVVLLVVVYRNRMPGPDELDPDLPNLFLPPFFSWWVLVLALAAIYLLTHLVWAWVQARRGAGASDSGAPARFPDLESAWDEIRIRLSHARYDAGRQKVFLLLGTEESTAAAMIRSAGLQFFAQAPVDENAPIHAYATADALFISCAGACSWGRGGAEGTDRLVELCRKVLALNPEQPVLRGVVVLYPMENAASPELLQGVAALRNDLQTIRAELSVRCPTLAVFCLRAPYAGFDEFVARIPSNVRIRRCGFSVPSSQPFDRAAALKGLSWLAQWFSTWSMKLMTDDYHNTEGNNRLVTMNAQLWRDLPALGHLLDVSFSTHARAEPILVRGCYFVSCGPDPESQAFAAGLVGGKSSKMLADAVYTTWSGGAGAIDRRYRLAALGLGAATAVIGFLIWNRAILDRLEQMNVRNYFPAGHWLAWGSVGTLVLAWAAGLLYQWFGRRGPAKPAAGT